MKNWYVESIAGGDFIIQNHEIPTDVPMRVTAKEYVENTNEVMERANGRTVKVLGLNGKVIATISDPKPEVSASEALNPKAKKSKSKTPDPSDKPVLSDTCRDTLEHAIEGIELESVKYYEGDDENSITIIIKGRFDDDKQAEDFMHGTRKKEYNDYDRAMKGI